MRPRLLRLLLLITVTPLLFLIIVSTPIWVPLLWVWTGEEPLGYLFTWIEDLWFKLEDRFGN
jgi:hypothetical protein